MAGFFFAFEAGKSIHMQFHKQKGELRRKGTGAAK